MSRFSSSRRPLATAPALSSLCSRLLSGFVASVLAFALMAGGLVAVDAPQAQAQAAVTVRLAPAATSGDVGDVFTIKVYVDNVPSTGVQGWQVSIDFDPTVVQLKPGQDGSTYFAGNLYTAGGYSTFPVVNATADKITLGQALLGTPSSYPGGSNLLLATIQWQAVGTGASALDTNMSKIMKDALNGISYSPLTELDGQITVLANPYDVNDDGAVDVLDVSLTAENWQSTDPAVLAIFDFNDNEIVDVADIMLVTANLTG